MKPRTLCRCQAVAATISGKLAPSGRRRRASTAACFDSFLYENRWGVERDEARALELYRIAADAGEAFAIHNVAVYHADGRGGLEVDEARAVELYGEASALGWEPSMLSLGLAHSGGLGASSETRRRQRTCSAT